MSALHWRQQQQQQFCDGCDGVRQATHKQCVHNEMPKKGQFTQMQAKADRQTKSHKHIYTQSEQTKPRSGNALDARQIMWMDRQDGFVGIQAQRAQATQTIEHKWANIRTQWSSRQQFSLPTESATKWMSERKNQRNKQIMRHKSVCNQMLLQSKIAANKKAAGKQVAKMNCPYVVIKAKNSNATN